MSEVTCNTNKCNWSNSFSVNALGTLDNVLECETCGKRDYQTNRQRPEHLRHLETERYKALKELSAASKILEETEKIINKKWR